MAEDHGPIGVYTDPNRDEPTPNPLADELEAAIKASDGWANDPVELHKHLARSILAALRGK